jgi:hypothetical protein
MFHEGVAIRFCAALGPQFKNCCHGNARLPSYAQHDEIQSSVLFANLSDETMADDLL